MLRVCAFGEIMARFIPSKKVVFETLPKDLEFSFGGSEANFLSNISNFGGRSYFISALPDNYLGRSCLKYLNAFNINNSNVKISKKGRMGLYFIEEGFGTRASEVLYDRKGSSINYYNFEDYDFGSVFKKCDHYHISGISAALSEKVMHVILNSARLAKEMGLTVSCDLNFRNKLWNYKIRGEKVDPGRIISEVAIYCDYLFGNEMDIQKYFDFDIKNNEYKYEQDDIVYYENLLLRLSQMFPHNKLIALSLRKSLNANANFIGGVLYIRETNQFYFSPNDYNKYKPHLVEPICDRVGSGDAFSAGMVYGLNKFDQTQVVLDFAVASSVLKHSYRGDFNYASLKDVRAFIQGDKYGRIKR